MFVRLHVKNARQARRGQDNNVKDIAEPSLCLCTTCTLLQNWLWKHRLFWTEPLNEPSLNSTALNSTTCWFLSHCREKIREEDRRICLYWSFERFTAVLWGLFTSFYRWLTSKCLMTTFALVSSSNYLPFLLICEGDLISSRAMNTQVSMSVIKECWQTSKALTCSH